MFHNVEGLFNRRGVVNVDKVLLNLILAGRVLVRGTRLSSRVVKRLFLGLGLYWYIKQRQA